jgi:hypothetical protein
MPIDFPNNPQINEQFTSSDGRKWYWTGTVWNIVTSAITLDAVEQDVTNLQNETQSIQTSLNGKAPIDSPTFTGTVTLPSTTSVGSVSATELGYLDGATSSIQTQLNGKSDTSHNHSLSSLTGVSISSPLPGQPLVYNGTAWVNGTANPPRQVLDGTGTFTLNLPSSTYSIISKTPYVLDGEAKASDATIHKGAISQIRSASIGVNTSSITTSSVSGFSLRGFAYGNNVYVISATQNSNGANVIRYSTNLVSWTTASIPAFQALSSKIAFGNGVFVVPVSYALPPFFTIYGGGVLVSSNGINWSFHATGGTAGGNATGTLVINDIIFANGYFYVVTGGGSVIRSSDGVTWTSSTTVQETGDKNRIAYDRVRNRLWVRSCLNGNQDFVYFSDNDGATWGGGTSIASGTRSGEIDIAANDGTIILSSNGIVVYSQQNGSGWASVSTAITSNAGASEYLLDRFIITGNGTLGESFDGVSWTYKNTPLGQATDIDFISQISSGYIISGSTIGLMEALYAPTLLSIETLGTGRAAD